MEKGSEAVLNKRVGLHKIHFGVAFGVIAAVGVFLLGLAAWLFNGWGEGLVNSFSSLYIGFEPTFLGSIIGAVWAFVDGFLGGFLVAWLYNVMQRKQVFRDL